MAQKHIGLYGNLFTYTLLDERATMRAKRSVAGIVVAVMVLLLVFYVFRRFRKTLPADAQGNVLI